jgi:hypothetical protein
MTATNLVDNVMMRVRAIIRRHEPCASRHMLDVSLGDFERDLRRDLDHVIELEIAEAQSWDAEED